MTGRFPFSVVLLIVGVAATAIGVVIPFSGPAGAAYGKGGPASNPDYLASSQVLAGMVGILVGGSAIAWSRSSWRRLAVASIVLRSAGELSILGEANMMPEPKLGTFFEALCDTLRELDPGCAPIPSLMSGGTDARNFAHLGIRTSGFLPTTFLRSALEFGAAASHQAVERCCGWSVSAGSLALDSPL